MMGLLTAEAGAVSPVITTEMLQPVVDGVGANIGVIVPVGIGLFAILLGVKLIPKVLGSFFNA